MLKRILGILFTLAALATFVWVAMGSYSSWCFGGGTTAVETTHGIEPASPVETPLRDDRSGDAVGQIPAETPASGQVPAAEPAPAQPAAANPLQ